MFYNLSSLWTFSSSWDRVSNILGPGRRPLIPKPPCSTCAVLGLLVYYYCVVWQCWGLRSSASYMLGKHLTVTSPVLHLMFFMSLSPGTSLKQPQALSLFLFYSLFLWQPESSKTQCGAASKFLRAFTATWCIQDAAHLVLYGLQSWPPPASAHYSYTRLFGSDVNTSWWPSFSVWTHSLKLACNKIIHLLMANALLGRTQVSCQP